jgi:hypothetical protein
MALSLFHMKAVTEPGCFVTRSDPERGVSRQKQRASRDLMGDGTWITDTEYLVHIDWNLLVFELRPCLSRVYETISLNRPGHCWPSSPA